MRVVSLSETRSTVKCEFVTVWEQFVDFLGKSCTALLQCVFSGNCTQKKKVSRGADEQALYSINKGRCGPHSPVERGQGPFGANLGPIRFGLPSHVDICEEIRELRSYKKNCAWFRILQTNRESRFALSVRHGHGHTNTRKHTLPSIAIPNS